MRDYTRDGRYIPPQDPNVDVRDGMPGYDRPPTMDGELRHGDAEQYARRMVRETREYPYGYSGRHRHHIREDELMHCHRHASRAGYAAAAAAAPEIHTDGETVTKQLNLDVILDCFAGHDMLDEIDVSQKYIDYSCALKRDDQMELAELVAEMAYEEFTHARFQKEVLMDHGVPIDPEVLGAYEELKERLERMFRS